MKPDDSTPTFDLIVSLDRSDKTVALAVLDVATGAFLDERDLSSSPGLGKGVKRKTLRSGRTGGGGSKIFIFCV